MALQTTKENTLSDLVQYGSERSREVVSVVLVVR